MTAHTDNGLAISVRGLSKRFGEVQAVKGLDFDVHSGELFGFLGPNGAGKTTTINMLIGLARPDAGTVEIDGVDCTRNPRAAQDRIGVVPDESNLYPELSGFANLCFCAALYGMGRAEREQRARELLALFDLDKAAHRKFGGYSKGMKRKLTIAAGISHSPRILFLDEPTTGIDVASARHLRQLIAELNRQGTTVFLTTHYIEEAERLCDRVAFLKDGHIARIDTVANLVQPIRDRHVMHIACGSDLAGMVARLAGLFPDLQFKSPQPNLLRVEADGPVRVGPLVRALEDEGIEVFEARRMQPSLEEVFVQITGIGIDAMRREKEKGGGRQ